MNFYFVISIVKDLCKFRDYSSSNVINNFFLDYFALITYELMLKFPFEIGFRYLLFQLLKVISFN